MSNFSGARISTKGSNNTVVTGDNNTTRVSFSFKNLEELSEDFKKEMDGIIKEIRENPAINKDDVDLLEKKKNEILPLIKHSPLNNETSQKLVEKTSEFAETFGKVTGNVISASETAGKLYATFSKAMPFIISGMSCLINK